MDNPETFRTAASILEAGRNIALVTVVAATGSTPGKCGYKMLIGADSGETFGTVGGGALEAEMIREAQRMVAEPKSRLFHFDLGETPDDERGICGGSVEFLIETFDSEALPLFEDLSDAVIGRAGVLVSIIAPDELPRKILLKDAGQIDAACSEMAPEIIAAIRDAATGYGATRVSGGGMDVFVESVARAPTVVVFGAGHVSGHVARFAKSVHFRVVVCDDRSEYANRERFPDADEVVVEDFGHIFDKVQIDADCYLVIVTRGHRWDEIVLEQAVRTDARYVGMIGSRRKTLTILDKLKRRGIGTDVLNKVYAPIGVSIGAVTAEEIALSIVGELVKIRRLGDGPGIGHMALSRSGEHVDRD